MATDETRKAVSGWKQIQNKNNGMPTPRKINESVEPVQRKQQVMREEDTSGIHAEDLMAHLRKNSKKMMTEQVLNKKQFKGSANDCMMKLHILYNGSENADGMKIPPKEGTKVINVEQSGFGQYTITWVN